MNDVIRQGLPTGIQNSVISIGNITVQANINSFGAHAMAGVGAYSKIEGFVFLPIMSMSMSLPTFISQNFGAGKIDRAKKGAVFGILFGMITAVNKTVTAMATAITESITAAIVLAFLIASFCCFSARIRCCSAAASSLACSSTARLRQCSARFLLSW
jgi:hypothetical protein